MDTDNDRRYAGAYTRPDLDTRKEIAEIMIDEIGRIDRGNNVREINREIKLGPIGARFTWRSGNRFMGRFGGGWNWALGVKIAKGSILFNLIFCSILFSRCKNGNR